MRIRKKLNHALVFFVLSFFTISSLAKNTAEFDVKYQKAQSKTEQKIKAWLELSTEIELVHSLINQELKLNEPLTLVFGGSDGPLFDSGINKIIIPYEFILEVEERFKRAKYASNSGLSNKEAVMDALLHTIFHELAHALIFQFDLPVLGKEEDAADGLASILLIEYLEEGQEVVITAADLFDLESQDIDEFQEQDFWDEHSLDVQRYYSAMCHVYGSAPKKYRHIKQEQKFPAEKAENCVDDYNLLVSSWFTILEPYLNEDNK